MTPTKRPQSSTDCTPGKKCVKLVLVGDTTVGKSSLITNYEQQTYSDDYEPTVLDIHKGDKNFMNQTITLEVHDTSGDPLHHLSRRISYNLTDCFMICVAINNRTSYENIEQWKDEIKATCPDTPIIIVGTKSDLR